MKVIKGSDLLELFGALSAIEDTAELAEQAECIRIVVSGLQMRRHTIWVARSFRDKWRKSIYLLRLIWRGDKGYAANQTPSQEQK